VKVQTTVLILQQRKSLNTPIFKRILKDPPSLFLRRNEPLVLINIISTLANVASDGPSKHRRITCRSLLLSTITAVVLFILSWLTCHLIVVKPSPFSVASSQRQSTASAVRLLLRGQVTGELISNFHNYPGLILSQELVFVLSLDII
jgi:hypothetical protein